MRTRRTGPRGPVTIKGGIPMNRRISVLLTMAALGAVLAPSASAAGKEHGRFRLVIEGEAHALRLFSVGGEAGLCEEALSGARFTQDTQFLRGKGVELELVRKRLGSGFEYGAKRIGHKKADWTVVATSSRDATGTESFVIKPNVSEPLKSMVKCPETPPDLGSTPGCGTKKTGRDEVGLEITGNSFSVVPAGDVLAAPLPKPTCGESPLTQGFLKLGYEWPDYAPVTAVPFPDGKLFSRANAVAVKLEGKQEQPAQAIGTPPLTGTMQDVGTTTMTVRFIRCGERKQPAC